MTMTPEDAERRKRDRRQTENTRYPGPERRVNDRRAKSDAPEGG